MKLCNQTEEAKTRFQAEVIFLSSFKNTKAVQILHDGLNNKIPYFVMKFLS